MSLREDRRSYQQHCGLARALDVVGERWTLLIVRDLLIGPRRYGEVLEGLPGLTPNLLARRLKEMEEADIVEKAGARYRLTTRGRALEPALLALGGWGAELLKNSRPGDRRNLRWALVSLKRRYAGGQNLVVELRLPETSYGMRLLPDRMEAAEGEPVAPDLVIRGSEPAFLQLFFKVELGAEPVRFEGAAEHQARFGEAFGL